MFDAQPSHVLLRWISTAAVCTIPAIALADAALFQERCSKCHARANTLATGLKGQTADDKASRLDGFLKAHHAEDAEVRAKIVSYLVGLSKK